MASSTSRPVAGCEPTYEVAWDFCDETLAAVFRRDLAVEVVVITVGIETALLRSRSSSVFMRRGVTRICKSRLQGTAA